VCVYVCQAYNQLKVQSAAVDTFIDSRIIISVNYSTTNKQIFVALVHAVEAFVFSASCL